MINAVIITNNVGVNHWLSVAQRCCEEVQFALALNMLKRTNLNDFRSRHLNANYTTLVELLDLRAKSVFERPRNDSLQHLYIETVPKPFVKQQTPVIISYSITSGIPFANPFHKITIQCRYAW